MSQPRKVLHIISGLQRGGAEMSLYRLLKSIDRDRYHNRVISLSGAGAVAEKIHALDINIEYCHLKQTPTKIAEWRNFCRIVRQCQPDVIQGWMYHGNLFALFAQRLLKPKRILAWNIRHSLISLRSNRFLTRQTIRLNKIFSRCPDAIIYNSSRVAAEHEKFGFAAAKSKVISNGFDTGVFKPSSESRIATRRSLGINSDQVVVGYVARYHPVKDHENLCNAASHLIRNDNKVLFVMVGKDVTPRNPAIMEIIKKHALEKRVLLLGERDHVEQLIPAFDIACSASSGESFPNAVGEAMACGVPCVVTDVGQSGEIIGDTGYLVPPAQPIEFAQALNSMIALGPETRKKLGAKARARIIEHYSLSAMKQNYEMFYSGQSARMSGVHVCPAASELRNH